MLSVIRRDGGAERLCVTQQISGDVEVTEETCVIDGWRLRRRIVLQPSELATILNTLLEALKLGVVVRPTSDDDASELADVGSGEAVSLTALGPTPVDALAVERLHENLKRNEAIGAARRMRKRR